MVRNAKQLVNDNDVLKEHPLYDIYHKSLHDISLKDYPHDNYFREDIDAIDIDKCEEDNAAGSQDKTMDAMVGIADYSGNSKVNSRLLLVELRMDYDSTKSLRHSKLKGKVVHTRAIVHSALRVDEDNVFVFREDVVEQAKKWMFNMANQYSEASNWIAVSPKELENLLPPASSIKYQPITNMAQVATEICQKIKEKDLDSLMNMIEYWHNVAEDYKRKYQLKEEQHIKNELRNAWVNVKHIAVTLDPNQQAFKELIEEEYAYLVS